LLYKVAREVRKPQVLQVFFVFMPQSFQKIKPHQPTSEKENEKTYVFCNGYVVPLPRRMIIEIMNLPFCH
jgi:hypothetical protein